MVLTTYPLNPERPVTREEIDRLTAWETKGRDALLILNRAGYAGSEYTGSGGLILAVEAALVNTESVRRVKEKIIAQLNDELDASAEWASDLIHKNDRLRARAEVAESLLSGKASDDH